MFPRRVNCKVHRIEPLSESAKLRMGCASSQAGLTPGLATANGEPTGNGSSTATTEISLESGQYPPAEAFEIPIVDDVDEGNSDSLIKKHPPKRLQRLTEMTTAATTIEDLEEKLAKAEIRRQQYLQQRVESLGTGAKSKEQDDDEDDEDIVNGGGRDSDAKPSV